VAPAIQTAAMRRRCIEGEGYRKEHLR